MMLNATLSLESKKTVTSATILCCILVEELYTLLQTQGQQLETQSQLGQNSITSSVKPILKSSSM